VKRFARNLFRDFRLRAAIGTVLALGIGANLAIFSVANATLFRKLGVSEPERLVWVKTRFEERGTEGGLVPYANLKDLELASNDFAGLAISQDLMADLGRGGESARSLGAAVSAGYFSVLGVPIEAGRDFGPSDETPDAPPVVVLSGELWRERYGSDPAILGRGLFVNGVSFTVIGVGPRDFEGLAAGPHPRFWIPTSQIVRILDHAEALFTSRDAFYFNGIARLAPDVSFAEARARTEAIGKRLALEHRENEGRSLTLAPLDDMNRWIRPAAALVVGASALVFFVACANAANLWAVLLTGRRQEIIVRRALGASRARLVRDSVFEVAGLCALAGLGAMLLSTWYTRVLLLDVPLPFPLSVDARFDGRVLVAGLGLALVSAVLVGLYPALVASRADLASELRAARIGHRTVGARLFVATEVGLSLVSLVVAGLLVRSYERAAKSDLGFDAEEIVVVALDLRAQGYDEERARSFQTDVLERARAIPGVASASFATHVPLWWEPSLAAGFASRDRAAATDARGEIFTTRAVVSSGYFGTLGIRLREGREFAAYDDEGAPPVVILSESLAKRLFPEGEAIGKTLSFRGTTPGMGMLGSEDGVFQVVGVAADASHLMVGHGIRSTVYVPLSQQFSSDVVLHARAEGDPNAVLTALLASIRAMDEDLPFRISLPISQVVGRALFAERIGAALTSVFGLVTLFLSCLGIYGVLARATTERTREIGLRMALGAGASQILRLVVGQGMRPVFVGTLVGVGAALGGSRLLSGMLFEISPADPLTYGSILAVVGTTSVLACFLPARRASKLPPANALRHE
jgi:putative ABC transport system permease protein